jgi:hypothetical protein
LFYDTGAIQEVRIQQEVGNTVKPLRTYRLNYDSGAEGEGRTVPLKLASVSLTDYPVNGGAQTTETIVSFANTTLIQEPFDFQQTETTLLLGQVTGRHGGSSVITYGGQVSDPSYADRWNTSNLDWPIRFRRVSSRTLKANLPGSPAPVGVPDIVE